MGRLEAFAMSNPPGKSFIDGRQMAWVTVRSLLLLLLFAIFGSGTLLISCYSRRGLCEEVIIMMVLARVRFSFGGDRVDTAVYFGYSENLK